MSEEIPHKLHIFQWVAHYTDKDGTDKLLYQFDETSEYYDKVNKLVRFKPIVLDMLNKEGRLKSFHLIPRGQELSQQSLPRYTVDLTDGTFHVNGQMFRLFPGGVELSNYRLIYFFATAKVGTGTIKESNVLYEFMREYKLGLQVNDADGKNYQKIMVWNAEDESITIQDNR